MSSLKQLTREISACALKYGGKACTHWYFFYFSTRHIENNDACPALVSVKDDETLENQLSSQDDSTLTLENALPAYVPGEKNNHVDQPLPRTGKLT